MSFGKANLYTGEWDLFGQNGVFTVAISDKCSISRVKRE